jgi:NADH-quinone oxidoreductase subunit L
VSSNFWLLLVPVPTLAAFMTLAFGPFWLGPSQVRAVALAGAWLTAALMLAASGVCASGTCHLLAPVFTVKVGTASVALALILDPLATVVGTTVAIVGGFVISYSLGYMARARLADLRRFFAYMNLFLGAMLTMVMAGDSINFFLGWEMMGLCSFFLIGYNMSLPRAFAAGRKAFVITRFGDVLLLAGLLLLFYEAGGVRIDALVNAALVMPPGRRSVVAVLLLGGALAKSAQLPFHTWLPVAMAGPTPVSALLHSATMVAAGAFLLARFAPLFAATPEVLAAVAMVGAFSSCFGALVAVFQTDVKRMLAYSSISQIGFMIISIGVGAPQVAIAHFVIHAIFKSLLFLSAGDMAYAAGGRTDIAALAGSSTRRPIAYFSFAAGAASLAGLPLITAGWWSKEAILASAVSAGPLGEILWSLALIAVALTATYATRAVLVGAGPSTLLARPPAVPPAGIATNAPLVLLAAASLAGGLLVGPIVRFLGAAEPDTPAFSAIVGAAAVLLGVSAAFALRRHPHLASRIARARKVRQGFRIDAVYQQRFVRPFRHLAYWLNGVRRGGRSSGIVDPLGAVPVLGIVWLVRRMIHWAAVDRVDRVWMRLAAMVPELSSFSRRSQTGRVRDYALSLIFGIAALLLLALKSPRLPWH